MMRTEEDLRAALASRERLAPAPETVVSGIRRRAARRRRVRTVGVLATATLAVTAAAVVPAVLLRPGPATFPATSSPVDAHAADRPDFSFTVAAGQVAGFELRPESVDASTQTVTIRPADGDRLTATLVLYRPGQGLGGAEHSDGWGLSVRFPDPAQAPNAQVNGGPAWFDSDARWSGLTWQYAPDAYAGLETNAGPLSRQTLVQIAEAVRFVDPYPARVPYRLDYLPAGLRPYLVIQPATKYYSYVGFVGRGRPTIDPRKDLTPDYDGIAPAITPDIAVTDDPPALNEHWFTEPTGTWEPTTVAGRPAQCSLSRCNIDYGEYLVSIGTGFTRTELEQIVAGLQFADPANPGTWFAIDEAIPGL
ncbi:MAG: hypothetical protein IRY85_08210 [Micromonosporaceae bacterium]|nr:hypothetical protein [Micromonosporaceae bacterium]